MNFIEMLTKGMPEFKDVGNMTEEEMQNLQASDGMLVKRPLLITEDSVLIGFKEKQWEETLV